MIHILNRTVLFDSNSGTPNAVYTSKALHPRHLSSTHYLLKKLMVIASIGEFKFHEPRRVQVSI